MTLDVEDVPADVAPKVDPVYFEVAGVVGRWLLTAISGALVSRHVLTADQGERVVTAIAHDLMLWMPAGAALLWSVWRRWQNRRRRLDPAFDRRASRPPVQPNSTA